MTLERFLSHAIEYNPTMRGKRIPYCPKCGRLITYHAMSLTPRGWIMRSADGTVCILSDDEMRLIQDIRDRIIAE
jgi:hypothetical protein